MTDAGEQVSDWERVIAELQAYRQTQRETWGEMSDLAVAMCLTGEGSEEQQKLMEKAVESHPALAELVGVVREVLGLPAPSAKAASAEAASVRQGVFWQATQEAANLVDRLVAWVDKEGQVIAAGLQSCFLKPQPAYGRSMHKPDADTEVRPATWEIPITLPPGRLTVSLQPGESSTDWKLCCRLQCASDPDLSSRCRFEIRSVQGELEDGGRLAELVEEPVLLGPGSWHLLLLAGEQVWRIPLELGTASEGELGEIRG